ncbi:MAG TPA: DUF58 domain-containing protein [Abditibacteriaceae bacterium]|jgi:uncharacterized protein (DUF58 family)
MLPAPPQSGSKNARREAGRNSAAKNLANQASAHQANAGQASVNQASADHQSASHLSSNRKLPRNKTKARNARREVNHVRLALLVAMLFTILVATMFRTTAIVFMAAFLCAAPLMGLIVGRLMGRGIAVARQLPEVGTSGDIVVGRLMLEQRGRIPTFLVHLRPGSIGGGAQPPLALHGPAEYVMPMLRPGETAEWSPQWRLGRRGVYQLPPVQAGARDPLGLFTNTQPTTAPDTITILPRPVRVARLGFCGGTQHGAHTPQAATATADATDFHGIRTWRPGEAIRRVHWKSTVRTGELHVVEWEEDPGCDLNVLFDARSFIPSSSTQHHVKSDGADTDIVDEALETQITIAASIAAHLLENGRIFRFFCWQPLADKLRADELQAPDQPKTANFTVQRHRAQRTGEIAGTMRVLAELQTLRGASDLDGETAQQCSLSRMAQELASEIGRGSTNAGGTVIICSTLSDYTKACAQIPRPSGAASPYILAVDPYSFVASADTTQRPTNSTGDSSPGTSEPAGNATPARVAASNVRVVRRGDSLITALER